MRFFSIIEKFIAGSACNHRIIKFSHNQSFTSFWKYSNSDVELTVRFFQITKANLFDSQYNIGIAVFSKSIKNQLEIFDYIIREIGTEC